MKTKKLLSILLALMMMLSVVPMYASAAEALKATNVTQYPTVSYKNADGKMYFGQTEAEGLIINDDEIVLDAAGNQVAGHFTFKDVDKIPTNGTGKKLNLTFVPDNTDEYTGFNKMFSPVLYDVETVTPVYVDEENDPVVASEIEAGATLSTSTLSGGKMTNPYNPEEPKILARTWEWVTPSTVVNESGYYEAMFGPAGYTLTYAQVYVRIAGEIPETTITEAPTVPVLTYDGVTTWGDIPLEGGKAELKVEGTAVEGTFAVTDYWKTRTVNPGSYEIDVVFTPADPEAALPYSLKIPVTVNKGQMKFVDENGNEIVPEITVPYGTTFGDIHYYLESYVAGDDAVSIGMVGIENANKTLCETGTYTASLINRTDSNYERTEKEFKIIVEAKKLEPTVKSNTGYYVVDDSGTYNVEGTFDVYIDGELYKSGVKYLEKVAYTPEKSGTHEIKFVYKPIENDNFAIENEIKDTFSINLVHKLTLGDNVLGKPGDYRYSTEIELSANSTAENFEGWVITDAAGNTVDLGVDLTATNITFTMPDFDLNIEAKEKSATSGGSGGIFDMDFGDLSEGDSEWAIINIIRNIIAMFKSFLQQLIETFQSIGD